MPGKLSLNWMLGVFTVSPCCCEKGVVKKGNLVARPLWAGTFLESDEVRAMSSSELPWKWWCSCRPSPWVTSEPGFFPPVVGRSCADSCLTWKNVRQELLVVVVVTATLLTLVARAASDSCVHAAPANISFAFSFHFQSQNTLFFPCESGNTCGSFSKTCSCGT